jgi:hypothetical protein
VRLSLIEESGAEANELRMNHAFRIRRVAGDQDVPVPNEPSLVGQRQAGRASDAIDRRIPARLVLADVGDALTDGERKPGRVIGVDRLHHQGAPERQSRGA